MDLAIEKTYNGNNWQVKLCGEIDIVNSAEFKSQLTNLIEEHVADIHIDCTGLEYIDSTGLGALVGILKNTKSHGKEVRLSFVKPNILKLFRITNLDKVFIIEEGDKDE
ncbi:MAG: STAS domain-containing protein [Defluviitaleaceae bacterium]|nr:STAS domain-containing protein [Defluviitaleaceae bacterium]